MMASPGPLIIRHMTVTTSATSSLDSSARRARGFAVLVLAATIGFCAIATAGAEDPQIATRRASERKVFSDPDIIKGFFKTAFGAEFRISGAIDRIRKYDKPVRIYIDGRGTPDRRSEVAEVVADIGAKIQHLDIAITTNRDEANMTVTLVRERDLRRTIRKTYGSDRARQIQKNLDPQCLSGFQKDETFRIIRSDVILVVDAGNFIFRDCAFEEMLQALGPINDTDIPWTMFNDDVQMGFFGIYDQYILNILYHPRIKAGMTVDEVSGLLPQILPKVRAFVARTNNLAP